MNRIKLFSVLALLALLLSAGPGAVTAQEPPPPIEAKIVEKTNMNTLIAYGNAMGEGKEALEFTMREVERLERSKRGEEWAITSRGLWDHHYYYSASGQTAWSDGEVRTKYNNTHVHLYAPSFYLSATINGHTKTTWTGRNPYYSDAIKLSEQWNFKGHGISVSAGSGGVGGSWNACGHKVTFDSDWVDTAGWAFSLSNLYSGVFADSRISLYEVDDSATGSHRFGNQIVTATANGGKRWWIW